MTATGGDDSFGWGPGAAPPPPPPHPAPPRRGSGVGRALAFAGLGCGGVLLIGVVALVLVLPHLDLNMDGGRVDGPGPGTNSYRLRVDVSPRAGLGDGAEVRVTSQAFAAGHVVGVTVCQREADLDASGVQDCDTTSGYRYSVDASGRLDATFPVPRVITVRGEAFDCASVANRCILVAADASDYDLSGGQTLTFSPDVPDVTLTPVTKRPGSDLLPVTGAPSSPVADGATVQVTARGFQPGEPILVARCQGFPDSAVEQACEPLDQDAATAAIMFRTTDQVTDHATPDGTFTTAVPVRPRILPFLDTGDAPRKLCTAPEAGCTIVVSAAADTRRSAVLPYWVS